VNLVLKCYKEALLTELQAQKHSTTQLHSLCSAPVLSFLFFHGGEEQTCCRLRGLIRAALRSLHNSHICRPIFAPLSLFVPKQFKTKVAASKLPLGSDFCYPSSSSLRRSANFSTPSRNAKQQQQISKP